MWPFFERETLMTAGDFMGRSLPSRMREAGGVELMERNWLGLLNREAQEGSARAARMDRRRGRIGRG